MAHGVGFVEQNLSLLASEFCILSDIICCNFPAFLEVFYFYVLYALSLRSQVQCFSGFVLLTVPLFVVSRFF